MPSPAMLYAERPAEPAYTLSFELIIFPIVPAMGNHAIDVHVVRADDLAVLAVGDGGDDHLLAVLVRRRQVFLGASVGSYG